VSVPSTRERGKAVWKKHETPPGVMPSGVFYFCGLAHFNMVKIYLDTSVINFIFADDAPEHQAETVEFFEKFIQLGIYETFVSVFVTDEIAQTKTLQNEINC